ncbi:hypothetical protein MM182_00620 [Aeromonas sp. MR19]|uniref:hypothetical protein n=1 Tax=Aeromonas sp. MR19 TaxID=2923421 RepID=UPI001F4A8AE0|nr:hypothetical protein [Aeromonas sp. MR19]MCH7373899.1 hypothetical protein [Aeromonas sp. MR19]
MSHQLTFADSELNGKRTKYLGAFLLFIVLAFIETNPVVTAGECVAAAICLLANAIENHRAG